MQRVKVRRAVRPPDASALAECDLDRILSATTSLAQALQFIKAYAAATPKARWIVGGGWSQEMWRLGHFTTAAELDTAVADRPAYLRRVDGHAGWTNSAGLRAVGITTATADGAGGRIERGVDGTLSGVFVDGAKELIEQHLPRQTIIESSAALNLRLPRALRSRKGRPSNGA